MKLSARWAVPFFFMISGYFIAPHLVYNIDKVARQAVKAFWILVASSLFLVPLLILRDGITGAVKKILSLSIITGGTYFHLWFLSSMALGLFVFYALQTFGMRKSTSALILSSLGILIVDAYYPGGRPIGHFATYFMCFPFMYLGMFFRWKDIMPKMSTSVLLLLLGFAMQNGEAFLLWKHFGNPLTQYDVLIGTIPFSAGLFFLSLRLQPTPRLEIFSKLGATYSLGIYVFHPYFIYFLKQNWIWSDGLYSTLIIPLTFSLTIIFLVVSFRFFPWFERLLSGNQSQIQQVDALIFLPATLPPIKGK